MLHVVRINMGAVQLLLLITCIALSPSSTLSSESGAKVDSEVDAQAQAEAAGVAEIQRALSTLQVALNDAREPWARRLEAARESLSPLLAALEAHTATVILHSRRHFDALQPAIHEKLEGARALLARTQEDLVTGVTEGGAAALTEVSAAVARARDQLAALWQPAPAQPAAPAPADSDSATPPPAQR